MRQRAWCSFFVVGLVELLLAPFAFAQDGGRVGLGVSISDVGDVFLQAFQTPTPAVIAPTIFVPINVSSRFRVEPEVGFYWNSSTNTYLSPQPQIRTLSSKVLHVGSGVFGLTSKERFTVYYGARFAYLRYTQSDVVGSGANSFSFPTATGFFVAPAVGGEYFLSDHVSFGGEVQVRYTSSTFHPNPSRSTQGISDMSAKTTSTHGAFTLRFWFGNK